jgi:hypothetical protein
MRELVVPPEAMVTVAGTWRAEEQALEIGSPLRHLAHRLSARSPVALFLGDTVATIASLALWIVAASAAHAFFYPSQAADLVRGTAFEDTVLKDSVVEDIVTRIASMNRVADIERLAEADLAIVEATSNAVSGRLSEVDIGDFSFLDGIAWSDPSGTTVVLASKPIAGRALASSPCVEQHTSALLRLRDAGFAELRFDGTGRLQTFGFGSPGGAQVTAHAVGGRYPRARIKPQGDRVSGTGRNEWGRLNFEVPLVRLGEPAVTGWDADTLVGALERLRSAVATNDLIETFRLLERSDEQASALAALSGIDADLKRFATLFLEPSAPFEVNLDPEHVYVGALGTNPEGAPFFNFFHFRTCEDLPILTAVAVNPR